MFFRVETNVQNTQRSVLITLLKEMYRACFPFILCIRTIVFCIKCLTETNESWAALWSGLVQKQAWPPEVGCHNTTSMVESVYSAWRNQGDRLALGHINRLLLFCRVKSCLKRTQALAAAHPARSSEGAGQRQTFLAGNWWYCLTEMDLKLWGKLFSFH